MGPSQPVPGPSGSPANEQRHNGARVAHDPEQIVDHCEEAWRKHNLLTIDGGGIRGYWSLLVLNQLMYYVAACEEVYKPDGASAEEPHYHSFHPQKYHDHVSQVLTDQEVRDIDGLETSEKPRVLGRTKRYLPCHYFDYVGGSSTGGLIAIMLGRLRMTVADCLAEYRRLGEEVFGNPRKFTQLNLAIINRAKYDAKKLQKVFESVASRRDEKRNAETKRQQPRFPSSPHLCKTFVTALKSSDDRKQSKIYLIRSYMTYEPDMTLGSRRTTRTNTDMSRAPQRANTTGVNNSARPDRRVNRGPAQEFHIWEVARAATAAPFYFDPIEIEVDTKRKVVFEDGGFGPTNNPTNYGINEIYQTEGQGTIGTVVSVGTARGEVATSKYVWRITQKLRRQYSIMSEPDTIHESVEQRSIDEGFEYFRFNPDSEEDRLNIELDDWLPRHRRGSALSGSSTIKTMEDAFGRWLLDTNVQTYFQECARALVERRRRRIQNGNTWERYAVGAVFACRVPYCNKAHRTWTEAGEFENHLIQQHHLSRDAVKLERAKAIETWKYRKAEEQDPPRKRSIRF